jgi:D-serine deaminase-like pyridoxal phosphate-dependent protein
MRMEELPTPALVIDLDRMERNIAAWQAMADRNGVGLRPHIKTHKVPAIALAQLEAGACGIASAKPTEAEVFVAAGCDDVAIAYPVVGRDKWRRAARLARTARMTMNVDSDVQARGLSEAAAVEGVTIRVQIEIDTGLHRVGIAPEDYPTLLEFARLLDGLPGLELDGVTTHRGRFSDRMTNMEAGRDEGQTLVGLAERLRADGFSLPNVTAGSSPSAPGVAEVPGVTEVRAGTYVFFDAMQTGFGACTRDDVALSILATVVSTRRTGWATVDAGSKTFSGDRGGVPGAGGDEISRCVDADAAVMRVTEEHGMVRLGEGAGVEVGQKLRFTPYHVCTAVNLAEELVGLRGGVVESVWPVAARAKTR